MTRTFPPLAWLKQRWRTGWAIGLALVVAASAFRIIEARALDSPTGDEWLAAGTRVFEPWLERDGGEMAFATWLWREAEAGEWIWSLGSMDLNGQWDPRLGALGAAAVLALAVFGMIRVALRGLGGGAAFGVALGATVVWSLPGVGHEVAGAWSGKEGWLWGLGFGHLALTWTAPRRPWGHLLGLAAALASPAGAASAFALIVWVGLERRRGADGRGAAMGTAGWNAVLIMAVVGRSMVHGEDGLQLSPAPTWAGLIGIGLLTAPGLVMAAKSLGERGPEARQRGLLGVATFWMLLLALAEGGPRPWATAVGVAVAFPLQAASWAHLRRLDVGGRRQVTVFAWAWLAAMLPVVIAVNRDLPLPLEITQEAQRRVERIRVHAATGDREVLADALRLPEAEAGRVAGWLRDTRLKPWLPSSVRAPLEIWDGQTGAGVFSTDRVPFIPGLPAGYTAVASEAGGETGEGRSRVFETRFPLLQVYVAGVGEAGRTELEVQSVSGEIARPLQTRFDATGAWRRINLPAPGGPAALVVRDTSPETWLAVASPVELGRGTWVAGKVAEMWFLPGLAGLLLMGVMAIFGFRDARLALRNADAEEWRGLLRWAPWVALAAYALVLSGFVDTHAAGADAAGYLAQARMLRDGELTAPMRMVPGVEVPEGIYVPLGFVPRADGQVAPGYPAGLPLMVAAFASVLPFEVATALVILLHIVGGVVVVRLLARACGLPEGWAWLAALWVGISPVYLFMGLQPMSDVPSLVWLSVALLFALRSREGPGWAVACGAATAMAVLLRPANALAFVPLVITLGSWKAVALWILGAGPGAAWHLWRAWKLYGSPLATGYGDMSGAFGWEWVGPTVGQYVVQLPVNFTPLIALACVAPFLSVAERRVRWALATWAGLFLVFYAGYFFTHLTWWYQRFLAPAYPALVILALLALRAWVERRGLRLFARGAGAKAWIASVALAACLVVPAAVQGRRLLVLHPADGNSRYTELAQWAEHTLPPGAAIFAFEASTALFHHTEFTVLRFDQVERVDNARVAQRLLQLGRPVYAVVFHLAEQAEINTRLPEGEWREVHRIGHMEVRELVALGSSAVRPDGEN